MYVQLQHFQSPRGRGTGKVKKRASDRVIQLFCPHHDGKDQTHLARGVHAVACGVSSFCPCGAIDPDLVPPTKFSISWGPGRGDGIRNIKENYVHKIKTIFFHCHSRAGGNRVLKITSVCCCTIFGKRWRIPILPYSATFCVWLVVTRTVWTLFLPLPTHGIYQFRGARSRNDKRRGDLVVPGETYYSLERCKFSSCGGVPRSGEVVFCLTFIPHCALSRPPRPGGHPSTGGELAPRWGYRDTAQKNVMPAQEGHHCPAGTYLPLPRHFVPPLRQRRGIRPAMVVQLSPLLARRGAGHTPGRVVVFYGLPRSARNDRDYSSFVVPA